MVNTMEYLSCDKSKWYIDIPMIIAQKSTKLWLGKGFLFNSSKKEILDYLNEMNLKDKWLEKFYKFGLQNSLMGKVFIMIIINEDNSKSLKILPNSFCGRVAKYNEQEQSAEFYFINEQADSATLTWVTIQNGKVKYETYKDNNKDIILGSTRTKLKPNITPLKTYEIKNPFNYIPIFEITNLPIINLYGNATTLNAYPDCTAVWDLIYDLNRVIRQKRLERELNVTTLFASLDNETAKEMQENGNIIENPKKDMFVNVGSAGYDKNGNGGMQIIQGDPKFSEYWLDYNGTAKAIFNGAGYDYDEHGNDVYTNKTQSMFNNKFDMETTEIKIAFYSAYFYRIFDLLLISKNLWNGIGERPYSFKFIPIAMTDQIVQDQIINSRLNNGTMTVTEAIGEYDNIDQLMAENKLENIIIENKKLNKELGDNENEQSSTNSINETRTSTSKETTSNN
ncbi:hypothetical protein [Spiroplasma endosymbiont of Virgichneumon dumeticola]|uniref:hypothetical protein n=1 Tax=Spiroplasma endosymbiont of Virgichneumon dumeticola TaxID=3139323 RepID=UPI0035C8C680